eukprot:CAMPEP_0119553456 /NCGR_PEP_ID=MMETSP1352-20130426/6210_1 /TAXON_ID=265584 /ORGANISM="Stauroneis constricta, Strain CCMP1120" /LENGTH=91 /DNA_ID=CAMNT_0007599877 /DNA_START=325 /DNA_END=596 /DNA_ORIENTATION=-
MPTNADGPPASGDVQESIESTVTTASDDSTESTSQSFVSSGSNAYLPEPENFDCRITLQRIFDVIEISDEAIETIHRKLFATSTTQFETFR